MTIAEADALGARFPPLLLAADRVAATVAQGVHGRRRVGVGDTFWQFRPLAPGEDTARIDWRRSARADRLYVRDREWEASQTVLLWRDASPSMRWRSAKALPEKCERAELLLLALASLLLRAGEQVRLPGAASRAWHHRGALGGIAAALPEGGTGLPPPADLAHAHAVLFGDFLTEPAALRAWIAHEAENRLAGTLVHIVDPAEETLPYDGRVRFVGLEGEGATLLPRADRVREEYKRAFAAHRAALGETAAAFGWTVLTHRTDHRPEPLLLSLWTALSDRRR